MLRTLLCRALPLAFLALSTTVISGLVMAESQAATESQDVVMAATDSQSGVMAATNSQSGVTMPVVITPPAEAERWTAYGFNIVAPGSMWPMLELLHKQKFDWELASASRKPTPIMWAHLPPHVYGQYVPAQNVVRLSWALQGTSVDAATAYLAHELTHLTDDLNGKLGNMTGTVCYDAEARAFVNEANFWQMVVGPLGKTTQDAIEMQENTKMFAFVGNLQFADLVVRTTPSYVAQCGPERSQ
jgi:hypothetical protein